MKKLRARPTVTPRFFKAHGQGNDYLVFEEGPGPTLDGALARRICDRRRGPGGDGLVVVEPPGRSGGRSSAAQSADERTRPVRLRMFNPDGGEFERSGNGLRIAGVFLAARKGERRDRFPVVVGGDSVWIEVRGANDRGVFDVRVDMGRVGFPGDADREAERVRGDASVSLTVRSPQGAKEALSVIPVSVGNPHAVVFRDRWTEEEVGRYGPSIETHDAFEGGTNVQFAEPPEGRRVAIRIWERGVGRTLSSGTSACAVVAAAVRSGRMAPGSAEVSMEGGPMEVTLASDWSVRLRGPVEEVCEGELAPGFLAASR